LNAATEIFGLRDKSVLVTGASSGIGKAIAVSCASAGAKLVITGRDSTRLGSTFLQLSGGDHSHLLSDLSDEGSINHLADQSPLLDGLVLAAGLPGLCPIRMASRKFMDEVFSVNYFGAILLIKALLAKRKISNGGSVILLSSIAAVSGTHGVGVYAGSKAALIGTMRPLALELSRARIRVNAICPGLVDTPMISRDATWIDNAKKKYNIGDPADIAYACLYFLSDCSSKVTGNVFNMDGGVEQS
jgi:NAD(P)-dependent dehydrogenase (short-subunit alcohol dehydrogenase family)